MTCRRTEELWSDYLDGSLAAPLVRDVEEHLAGCSSCASLLDSFRLVVDTLHTVPRPTVKETLPYEILRGTRLPVSSSRWWTRWPRSEPSLPAWKSWASAAALAAMVLVALGPPESVKRLGQGVSRTAYRGYSLVVRFYQGTERFMEELTVIRLTVGVAFEDRLDRLNERLKDLQKAQQRNEPRPAPNRGQGSRLGDPHSLTKEKRSWT
jgi:hypothetical protein